MNRVRVLLATALMLQTMPMTASAATFPLSCSSEPSPAHVPAAASNCLPSSDAEPLSLMAKQSSRGMTEISSEVFEREFAAFVTRRVWMAYEGDVLSDLAFRPGASCAADPKARATERARSTAAINSDLNMAVRGLPSGGPDWWGEGQACAARLGMDGFFNQHWNSLSDAARNLKCGIRAPAQARKGCSTEGVTPEAWNNRMRERRYDLHRSISRLQSIERQLWNLNRGKVFDDKGNRMPDCTVSPQCDNPAALVAKFEQCRLTRFQGVAERCYQYDPRNFESRPDYMRLWKKWSALSEERDRIYNEQPELTYAPLREFLVGRIKKARIDLSGACGPQIGYGDEESCLERYRKVIRDASIESRRKKLKVVFRNLCDDPREFARRLVMANPRLVQEFLDVPANRGFAQSACASLGVAKEEAANDERRQLAYELGMTAVGVASSFVSGPVGVAAAVALTGAGHGLAISEAIEASNNAALFGDLHGSCLAGIDEVRSSQRESKEAWTEVLKGVTYELGGFVVGKVYQDLKAQKTQLSDVEKQLLGKASLVSRSPAGSMDHLQGVEEAVLEVAKAGKEATLELGETVQQAMEVKDALVEARDTVVNAQELADNGRLSGHSGDSKQHGSKGKPKGHR